MDNNYERSIAAEEAECSKAWAQSDARRNERVSQALRSASPAPPLDEITQRLDRLHGRLVTSLSSAIDILDCHADRVFGPVPETASGAKGMTDVGCGSGTLGSLFSMLSTLEARPTC